MVLTRRRSRSATTTPSCIRTPEGNVTVKNEQEGEKGDLGKINIAKEKSLCLELEEVEIAAEQLTGKLSDYLKTKGADVLWGSNIRLLENDLQEILPEQPDQPSPEKNVITECTMCNEELTSNHVCREYLERLQPHLSTVPNGGGEITLTQTSEECRKNLNSLHGDAMFVEDEGATFPFNSVSTKGHHYDNTPHHQIPDKDGHSVGRVVKHPFATSWISAVYSKDLFTYDQATIYHRAAYCYPILTKLGPESEVEDGSGGVIIDPESGGVNANMTAPHYYLPPPPPPKFVRSVKRMKRDAYFTSDKQTDSTQRSRQNKAGADGGVTKKRRNQPPNYQSDQNVTKNSSVGATESDVRHESAGCEEGTRRKRKYVRRTTKEEQIENGTALWQFLMRKLADRQCRNWIRWTGNDLEFKVIDQKEAAKQWGLVKNRAKMTFDKFSRSMRFYYSKGILVHNPDKRLTYIFCRQPHDAVYTEMLERVIKTLPPNTPHCGATCINPECDHELIKLHVRKRTVRRRGRPILIDATSRRPVDSDDESPDSQGMIHVDSDSEQYHTRNMTRSLIPEYVQVPFPADHPTSPAPYPPPNMTDPNFCPATPYAPEFSQEQESYSSSPMAALIAAASQAVAVPVPEPNVYSTLEPMQHHSEPPNQAAAPQTTMTEIMMSEYTPEGTFTGLQPAEGQVEESGVENGIDENSNPGGVQRGLSSAPLFVYPTTEYRSEENVLEDKVEMVSNGLSNSPVTPEQIGPAVNDDETQQLFSSANPEPLTGTFLDTAPASDATHIVDTTPATDTAIVDTVPSQSSDQHTELSSEPLSNGIKKENMELGDTLTEKEVS